jgi:hypothetical protein
VVSALVAANPSAHSVTPVFHLAVQRWWARGDLYADVRGFHYLPQFPLLFAPFHALPSPSGDILWRLASVAVCLYGIRAVVARLGPAAPGRFFFSASLLALAPCLGAVRNGQTNLAFGGLSLVVAALLADARWWPAAACLALLITVKPLGLILLLMAAVVYPRLRGPVAVAVALLAAAPFLFGPPSYVVAQYRDALRHLAGWSGTTEHRFADIAGLLRSFGVELPLPVSQAARVLAGGVTLLLAVLASSRGDAPRRALALVLLASLYLMLFNPMTEKNSYAIVAPPLAITAASWLSSRRTASLGWGLAFVLVSIGVFPELFSRIDRNLGLWWDPLMMLLVSALLASRILRRQPLFPDELPPAKA